MLIAYNQPRTPVILFSHASTPTPKRRGEAKQINKERKKRISSGLTGRVAADAPCPPPKPPKRPSAPSWGLSTDRPRGSCGSSTPPEPRGCRARVAPRCRYLALGSAGLGPPRLRSGSGSAPAPQCSAGLRRCRRRSSPCRSPGNRPRPLAPHVGPPGQWRPGAAAARGNESRAAGGRRAGPAPLPRKPRPPCRGGPAPAPQRRPAAQNGAEGPGRAGGAGLL